MIQIDNSKFYYMSISDDKLMYTTQSATDLTRHKKITSMLQLMSLYKYIPTAEYSKTLFNKKDKITISYVGETCFLLLFQLQKNFLKNIH